MDAQAAPALSALERFYRRRVSSYCVCGEHMIIAVATIRRTQQHRNEPYVITIRDWLGRDDAFCGCGQPSVFRLDAIPVDES